MQWDCALSFQKQRQQLLLCTQQGMAEHLDGGLCLTIQDRITPQMKAWKEVTVRCLCAAWRPLWPECVLQRDFEGFEELEEEAVVHEIVSLDNSMGLEVDDDDVEELVE
ncbi:putative Tigger transposable element-derived protein 1-like 338 [Homarus americanus]|uniref:Putative Tigger transposable element-derived protein 1-like 338 n=1 Tax=Homarus americanus TaxID=6706 RepID=A0A8J5MMU7_HOMAM|nr:putative Tigger transposable element-derived protein 1-like 338 [Homarus americanus]